MTDRHPQPPGSRRLPEANQHPSAPAPAAPPNPRSRRVPQPVFAQLGQDAYGCAHCGADQANLEADSFPSYGGTTEGYQRCDRCRASYGWVDLNAVI